MNEIIQCSSCGGSNQLPEGKTSMFCAFCGTSLKSQKKEDVYNASSIKSKPEISKKIVKKNEKKVDGDFPVLFYHNNNTSKIRKDGGWEVYDGFKWTFVRDKIIVEEQIIDKGGELKLTNRGIKNLDEIITWFTDDELETIRILNLSDNNIVNFDNLYRFRNVEIVDLSNNDISTFPTPQKFEKLVQIDLNNNPLPKNESFKGWQLFGSDFGVVFEGGFLKGKVEKMKCIECGVTILNTTFERNDGCCKKCVETVNKRTDAEIMRSAYNTLYKKPSKGFCFIATATMGSYDHPEVVELRNFRDNWILDKRWGESFVEWYYHYGANAAKFIEKSLVLKKISYILIVKPLVYLSKIVNTK
jgi:hypothetical protein